MREAGKRVAKILIIDDSAVIRDLLTEFLSESGHLVDSAVDGVEGLQKAASGDYDLCICDVHLPKMNGYQLLMELGGGFHHRVTQRKVKNVLLAVLLFKAGSLLKHPPDP